MVRCQCPCGCGVYSIDVYCPDCRKPHSAPPARYREAPSSVPLLPIMPREPDPEPMEQPAPTPPSAARRVAAKAAENEVFVFGVGEAFGRFIGIPPGVAGATLVKGTKLVRLFNDLHQLKNGRGPK
jgi:hypothetical protein